MLKLKRVLFAYTVNGKRYAADTDASISNKRLDLDITSEENFFTACISTRSPIEIIKLSAEFEYDFNTADKIFLNGYQSWTDSTERSVTGRMRGVDRIPAPIADKYAFSQYGDYTFVKYGRARGMMHGFSFGYIKHELGICDFIGSLNEKDGFTVISTDTARGMITVEKDCKGLFVTESYRGLSLYFGSGTYDKVFDEYFRLLDIPAPSAMPIRGYTSWYRHYQDISEDIISADLDGLINDTDTDFRPDVFQIDDGYQTAVGDWLSIDGKKFPNSMGEAAKKIKDAGLTAGLWLAPFVCEEKSELFREHPDWLLKYENGEPVRGGSNWSGFYALDIYNEDFREYLKNVFDTVVNEWGFGLLKLDFLYAACLLPREDKTRGEVMSDAMDILREFAGEAKILGCGVPLASAFGKVDYCRIGCDISLDWDDKPHMRLMHRERVSTKNSLLNSVFRRGLNGRAFLNDPDVFLLRDNDISLSYEQKKTIAEINTLCGGVLFTSDNFAEYGDAQKELLTRINDLGGAHITAADYDGKELILSVSSNGTEFIRKYKFDY